MIAWNWKLIRLQREKSALARDEHNARPKRNTEGTGESIPRKN